MARIWDSFTTVSRALPLTRGAKFRLKCHKNADYQPTDASEAMGIDEAMAEHNDFGASVDIHNKQKPKGSRSAKLKRLAAQFLLDCVSIDRELGIYMLEVYQKDWVEVMEEPNMGDFKSLEEYYKFRKLNIGMM